MVIEIPDDVKDIKKAESLFRKQWLHAMFPNKGMKFVARAMGVSYRTVIRWYKQEYKHKGHDLKESNIVLGACHFCGTKEGIHEHHINGRKNNNITINICAECHKKFHVLNHIYKAP